MFAEWSGAKTFVMTFLSNKLRTCLYSIHISLKDVPKSLKINEINDKLKVILSMLIDDLGISQPRVAVLGLNPHAGEGGIIGTEEENVIIPSLKKFISGGIVEGPFSSDAFFGKKRFKEYDMVFGLYHDQVLIPFKYINAGKGVNYTAGLPIVRTSPDHGVAYDIAGKGIADESSMLEAYRYAKMIVRNRKKNLQLK
jgi:4-hydroxythreonine-4-phosphate dehydrogenase